MTENPNSVKSFTDHADKIDILVPAWYRSMVMDSCGAGRILYVLQMAAQHHVPVMPIVATTVQADLHKLFITPTARKAFIGSLLSECKKNGYSGFQIDFENVLWTDRDLLSQPGRRNRGRAAQAKLAAHHCHCAQCSRRSRTKRLLALALCQLARRIRSESAGTIHRPDLPDDLRSKHAMDGTGPGRGLSLDCAAIGIRAAICSQRKVVAGHSALWVSLVCRRAEERRKAESDRGICRAAGNRSNI